MRWTLVRLDKCPVLNFSNFFFFLNLKLIKSSSVWNLFREILARLVLWYLSLVSDNRLNSFKSYEICRPPFVSDNFNSYIIVEKSIFKIFDVLDCNKTKFTILNSESGMLAYTLNSRMVSHGSKRAENIFAVQLNFCIFLC